MAFPAAGPGRTCGKRSALNAPLPQIQDLFPPLAVHLGKGTLRGAVDVRKVLVSPTGTALRAASRFALFKGKTLSAGASGGGGRAGAL